jgi:two-component system, NarL family, sensor kinase
MIRKAIKILEQVRGTEMERTQFLLNLGANQTDPDSALAFYRAALALSGQGRNNIPVIAIYNNMAYSWLDKGDIVNATRCILEEAIPLARSAGNYDWLSTLYDSYADILIAQRSFDQAVRWLRQSAEARRLSDQVMSKRQVRMLNAMLDLNRKNLLIVEKDREISIRNEQISRMTFWLALAMGFILSVTAFFLWYRQRARNRLQEIKLNAAQKIIDAGEYEKEKNGMELHDAIGVLGVKVSESFNRYAGTDAALKQEVGGHLEQFVSEMRTHSHRMNRKLLGRHRPGPLLDDLCREYAGRGGIELTHRIGLDEASVSPPVALHIFRIVQELLGNAARHAPGAKVTLTVTGEGNRIELEYTDDGPGFPPAEAMEKGMGLSNIFARASLIGGKAELDSVPGHGLYLKITAGAAMPKN